MATNQPERNYSVQEKEALGVVHAVDKFRHYLLGSPFVVTILSDHQSLTFLKNGKEKGGRLARWAMKLGEYNYTIKFLPGTSNMVADLLSRLVTGKK
eukprot:SAG11_NODE_4345_length_1939_cov_1.707065_1_plen_96_part_01